MADSKIEWTQKVWNPSTGCSKVSPGCKNCYADLLAQRLQKMGKPKYKNGFKYTEHQDSLNIPLTWKKPRKIFVNSMSDVFHEDATDSFINSIFDVMMEANWHTYQILTKRPDRMYDFIHYWLIRKGLDKVPKHIWLGVSCESQEYVSRIDRLRMIPAHVHFISFEPLLGLIPNVNLQGIELIIAGGESGPGFRPMKEEWALELLKAARLYGSAFFFKQHGGIRPTSGGRSLQGQEYNEFPQGVVA